MKKHSHDDIGIFDIYKSAFGGWLFVCEFCHHAIYLVPSK